jgi:ubiquinone biosynthesis protein COQ9
VDAAAGIATSGVRGELRVKGLVAVWLWTIRAWRSDESQDLSTTMAALDAALRRAESTAERLGWRPRPVEPAPESPATEEPAPEAPA